MAVTTDATAIRPLTGETPQADLEDLRARITATRWPEKETVDGPVAGPAARDDAGARALLGGRVRLAQVRGEAGRPAALHHRDRRPGHPFHSRSLGARRCVAAHRHARMARLDRRAAEDHRSADQPDGTWRERSGRVPSGDSVDAGLRVLGQADHDRLGSRTHRTCLGGADEAPRLHALRRPGRRLGRAHRRPDGCTGASGADRHPHQHALALFQPTSQRRSCRAARRRPVSTKRRPASSRTEGLLRDRYRLRTWRWRPTHRRCTELRIHPSAWPPGCSTTTRPAWS